MKKCTVWSAAIIILCSCLSLYGCNGGGKDDSSGNNPSGNGGPLRVLAKNVIFGSSTANAAPLLATGAVDTTTQVLAQNVVIDTASNGLTSDNLQSALDNELAIKLSAYLPGTKWSVANKTSDITYSGAQGLITFSTGTMSVNSGRFAAAGIVAASENAFCDIPLDPITYELLSEGVMYITWTGQTRNPPAAVPVTTQPQDATITIVTRNKDKMVLIGTGGCGAQGIPRISVLTKVP